MRFSNWDPHLLRQTFQQAGAGIKIGHLDTGVMAAHPALVGRVAAFQLFGYQGWPEPSPQAYDTGSHGTHTAGLMVGGKINKQNQGSTLGIAPDAKLHVGLVINAGNIISRILMGLDWLITQQVNVVCLPLGIDNQSPIFQPIIQKMVQHNIVVVASIGNRGAGQATAPGIYPEVISVGAVDKNGTIPSFSGSYHHYGTSTCHKPDLLAPGVDLCSAHPDGGIQSESGTSMAAAKVAGLIAAMLSRYPSATPAVIKAALIQSCNPRQPAQHHRSANGAIDPAKAWNLLETWEADPTQLDLTPPAWERESQLPERYIDPHLIETLRWRHDADLVEAIFYFADNQTASDFESWLAVHPEMHEGCRPLQRLKHTPYLIVEAPAMLIQEMIERKKTFRFVSAPDIDRTFRF